ncbi:MAG: hypothetical protein ACOYY2_13035 [Actinomycetota bacterium]
MSLRDTIFAAADIPEEAVEVPEWGVTVLVRGMTGRDRTRLMNEAVTDDGDVDLAKIYPDAIILCTYDPATGERVFADDDRDALLSKAGAALDRISGPAMRLSGFTKEARDEAGKDSSSTPSSASSTN